MECKKRKLEEGVEEFSFFLPCLDDLRNEECFRRWKNYKNALEDLLKQVKEEEFYFDLIEENDWEGETWHFYCSYPKKEREEFNELIAELDDALEDSSWSIGNDWEMKEEDVKALIKYSDSGYMAYHNYGKLLKLDFFKKFIRCEKCITKVKEGDHNWYKGDFSFECIH